MMNSAKSVLKWSEQRLRLDDTHIDEAGGAGGSLRTGASFLYYPGEGLQIETSSNELLFMEPDDLVRLGHNEQAFRIHQSVQDTLVGREGTLNTGEMVDIINNAGHFAVAQVTKTTEMVTCLTNVQYRLDSIHDAWFFLKRKAARRVNPQFGINELLNVILQDIAKDADGITPSQNAERLMEHLRRTGFLDLKEETQEAKSCDDGPLWAVHLTGTEAFLAGAEKAADQLKEDPELSGLLKV